MAEVNRCEHNLCNCAIDDDAEYCSPQCESAGEQELTEMKCDCGHSTCGGT